MVGGRDEPRAEQATRVPCINKHRSMHTNLELTWGMAMRRRFARMTNTSDTNTITAIMEAMIAVSAELDMLEEEEVKVCDVSLGETVVACPIPKGGTVVATCGGNG